MSLASGITAAFTAVANALNARNAPGPDAYQMAVAGGFVGDRAAWQQSLVGNDEDYAAYLNGLLTTPPRAGAATEAQTGVTQFATRAEMAAGALGTKAVSALRLRDIVAATSLADLSTKAALLPDGAIIALPYTDFGNFREMFRSVWYVTSRVAQPLTPLLVSSPATLTYLQSQVGVGKPNPGVAFDPFVSEAVVNRTPYNGSSERDQWLYIGATTGWILWRGPIGFTPAAGSALDSRQTRVEVDGNFTVINFAVGKGTGYYAQYDFLGTFDYQGRPYNDVFFGGGQITNSGAGWMPATLFAQNDGSVRLLNQPAAGANIINGSGTVRRQIPSA